MRSARILLTVACFLPLAPFAYADEVNLDDYVLFGVDGSSNQLVRFDFAGSTYQSIGVVHFPDQTTLTGIEGMAYVPKNLNLFGFWHDATNDQSRLIYISSQNAEANLVGPDLGPGQVTAATAALQEVDESGNLALPVGAGSGPTAIGAGDPTPIADIQRHGLFAVQHVESEEDEPVDFAIDGGKVVPSEDFAAKVTVLGAAITASGTYDVPVTVRLRIGSTYIEPWGDWDLPVNATVNDDDNPREHILPTTYGPGTTISLEARSWIKKKYWYSGNYNSHWKKYLEKDSYDNTPHILVLRDGDDVPDIEPFMNQTEIEDFIRDYVDDVTGMVVLDENQAIYLFELGTTNLSSSAADFQDLVVLVTLAKDPADLEEDEDDDEDDNVAARLIRVDPKTGGYDQIMTLNQVYDGLAASPTTAFYGTTGNELYLLDPIAQTETLVGTLPASDMKGLEYAGATMCGFTVINGQLVPIDATGAALDDPFNVGTTNLRTITFMRTADEPDALAAAYD